VREVAREAGLLRSLAEEKETRSSVRPGNRWRLDRGAGLAAAVYARVRGIEDGRCGELAPGEAGSSPLTQSKTSSLWIPTGIGGGD